MRHDVLRCGLAPVIFQYFMKTCFLRTEYSVNYLGLLAHLIDPTRLAMEVGFMRLADMVMIVNRSVSRTEMQSLSVPDLTE